MYWKLKCLVSKNMCSKRTKRHNNKAFNMITKKDEVKATAEHISYDCKSRFNSTTCNSSQRWNNKAYQCECKHYPKCKEDYNWNHSSCICENGKYLKSISDNSVT